jgi:hypothetical protein
MAQRQREEGDPAWKVNTHCCFCKRATILTHLRTKEINGRSYEQCHHCRNKTYVPEKEELFHKRKSEVKRGKRRVIPEYDPVNNYKIEMKPQSKENKDTTTPAWQKAEQDKREKWCTEKCQFMDHKALMRGKITYFNADTRMIHDTVNCPLGAVDYDEQGREQPLCLCYNRRAKYCQLHQHERKKCNCPYEERIIERHFGGTKCPAQGCIYEEEYQHCSHGYCRKHKVYIIGYKQPCKECNNERKFWEETDGMLGLILKTSVNEQIMKNQQRYYQRQQEKEIPLQRTDFVKKNKDLEKEIMNLKRENEKMRQELVLKEKEINKFNSWFKIGEKLETTNN